MTMNTLMINLLLVCSLTYLITLHKSTHDFKMWIYNKAYKNDNMMDKSTYYVHSKVYDFIYKLLTCPYCTGFHLGWITYAVMNRPDFSGLLSMFAFAFASAISSLIVCKHLS